MRGVPKWLEGTFAARPAANTLAANSLYYATDTDAVYESNGAAWSRVNYAALQAADVPDLSATYQVRSERGAANGYATLGAGGLVPMSQLASGTPDGTKFVRDDGTLVTPSGGGGGLSSLILFDSTLGANAASIDTGAAGIAQTAETLLVCMVLRTTDASTISQVNVLVNNDTGANYDRQNYSDTNTTVSTTLSLAQSLWALNACGANMGAGAAAQIDILIHNYRGTTFHKVAFARQAIPDATAANVRLTQNNLRWRSTAAISRLSVAANAGNLLAGSRMTVYGLQ